MLPDVQVGTFGVSDRIIRHAEGNSALGVARGGRIGRSNQDDVHNVLRERHTSTPVLYAACCAITGPWSTWGSGQRTGRRDGTQIPFVTDWIARAQASGCQTLPESHAKSSPLKSRFLPQSLGLKAVAVF